MDDVPTTAASGVSTDPVVRELLSRLSGARLIYHPSALRAVEAHYQTFARAGIHLAPAIVCDHLEPGMILWAEEVDGLSGSQGGRGETDRDPETVDAWPELEPDEDGCSEC